MPLPCFRSLLTLALSLSTLLGCSSGGDAGGKSSEPKPTECSSGLCLDTPENGFNLEAEGTTIGPGEDVQYCEVLALPGERGEAFFVSAIDGRMTRFSHHLNVMVVAPGSEADRATTPGELVECVSNGRVPFGSGLRQIFSMGSPEQEMRLPEGIGHRLEGGQKVVLNYHYFNTSEDEVPARAALAFHTTEAAGVTRELRRFGMYNLGIQIPARSKATFVSECAMAEDIQLVSLSRHTHRWGTDFSAWRVGGETDGDHLFTKPDWEHDITYTPDAPFIVRKGQGLRFECAFDNTTDHSLGFGELATDEMCILYGYFVGTAEGLPGPEDCMVLTATPGTVTKGAPCSQCPDGE